MIEQIRYSEARYAAPSRWNLEQLLKRVDACNVFVVALEWADPGLSPGVAIVITDGGAARAESLATAHAMNEKGGGDPVALPVCTRTWCPTYTDPARWPEGRPLAPDERQA